MKTYNAKFKRVFRQGMLKKTIEVFQTVDANSYKEARNKIREEHDNAMSIDITEVSGSFRDNTTEETAAYELKYGKQAGARIVFGGNGLDRGTMAIETGPNRDYVTVVQSKKLRNKALKDNELIKDTVLHTINSSDTIRKAVEELVKFRPIKIAMEDKIAEVLMNADICDYTEDFLVRFCNGHVSVEVVDARKKLDTDSGRVEETGMFEDTYGKRVV